jgi:hypothetical protein
MSEVDGPDVAISAIIPASCAGGDGSAFISVTGGTPGYLYTWSNGD